MSTIQQYNSHLAKKSACGHSPWVHRLRVGEDMSRTRLVVAVYDAVAGRGHLAENTTKFAAVRLTRYFSWIDWCGRPILPLGPVKFCLCAALTCASPVTANSSGYILDGQPGVTAALMCVAITRNAGCSATLYHAVTKMALLLFGSGQAKPTLPFVLVAICTSHTQTTSL